MTATYAGTEIDRYVAEVAEHLGALPEGERLELLDDLREHLAEVAAEGDGPLAVRVGPPADYAAEMLASAGLTPSDVRPRLTDQALVAWRSVQASSPYRSVADFLPELRPAWWVLRAVAAVFALNVLLVNDWERRWPWPDGGPFNRALVLLPLWLAIVGSVALGRRAVAGRSNRLVWLGNLLVVPAALFAVALMHDGHPGYQAPSVYERVGGFSSPDGRPVTNIYPYDVDGRLLHDVFLYDQDGRPIDVRDQAAGQGLQTTEVPDVNGAPVANAYPLQQGRQTYGDQPAGPVQPPAVVVPRVSSTSATAPPTSVSSAG